MSMDLFKDGRIRWVVLAFLINMVIMAGLLAWQLYDLTGAKWCTLAKVGTPDMATACVTALVRVLEVKDHIMAYLLAIIGLNSLSLTAVALGVRISANGPGGVSTNIGVDTDGPTRITIPQKED